MKKVTGFFCIVAAVLFLASTAFAQYPYEEFTKGTGHCKGDIEKFCKGVEKGGLRIWSCLKANESQVSEKCKGDMAKAQEKAKELKEACGDDLKRFCKGIEPGQGKQIVCLKANEMAISPSCKSFLNR